jgi:hypothetical protein
MCYLFYVWSVHLALAPSLCTDGVEEGPLTDGCVGRGKRWAYSRRRVNPANSEERWDAPIYCISLLRHAMPAAFQGQCDCGTQVVRRTHDE